MSEERKCKECKHFKIVSHSYVMGKERFPIWSCEKWDCKFEKEDSNEDNICMYDLSHGEKINGKA